MPRKKKERGRPMSAKYPPRIDAAPEEIMRVVLRAKPNRKFFDPPAVEEYRCGECGRDVNYPETLYNDGLCAGCHAAAK